MIKSKVLAFFGQTGYFFTNDKINRGRIEIYNEKTDGLDLAITVPAIDPGMHYISDKYLSIIEFSLPNDTTEQLILKKCVNEISYNEGKNKVEKIIYAIISGPRIDIDLLPKEINETLFYSLDSRKGQECFIYNSFLEIPKDYRKIPTYIYNYGTKKNDLYPSKSIWIVYYDFPKKKVDKIKYHIELEFIKDDKVIKVDKTYELYKKPFDSIE